MTYETDEEKVEAIKKWWKDNGLSIVGGVVIGLVAIYGWRFWVDYRNSVAGQASSAFEQMLSDADSGQVDTITKEATALEGEYGSTPYAALGSLVMAKALYEAGKVDEAMTALKTAIDKAPEPALARLAALRLARIQVSEGKLDQAAATVAAHDDSKAFAGEFAVVRGDIAAARGDNAAARAAYQQAIDKGTGLSQLVRLKLDNLPAAG